MGISLSRKVVVTGVGILSALGSSWNELKSSMEQGQSAVRFMPEWEDFQGLSAKIAAPVDHFEMSNYFTRKQTRSMDRVAKFAVTAVDAALKDAGLRECPELLGSGRVGVACGSAAGGTESTQQFATARINQEYGHLTPNTYIKMSPHTALVNIALSFGITGRLIPTSSACTSATQALGFAYESIVAGSQDVMIAGGAEELNSCQLAVFDNVFAASRQNEAPSSRPAPFDVQSDGLVMGEGAGFLVLEEYQHAVDRGATIYAEFCSFATNNDAFHITQPRVETMQMVLSDSLRFAGIAAENIDYISAHGTAAYQSDKAESEATYAVFGDSTPISTLKSFLGHSLGACGGLEAACLVSMLKDSWFHQTLNLNRQNPDFAVLDHIVDAPRFIQAEFVQLNNFAFGGINTSIVMRQV